MSAHLVAAIREHALKNYEAGWDVVVEAWEDKDIIEAIGQVQSVSEAINRVGKQVDDYNSYANDIRASAF